MNGEDERLLWLALGAVVAVLMALVWSTGALAGLVFAGAPATVPAARIPEIVLHLPSNLGDPRLAWPAAVRRGLPGSVGIYGVLTVEVGAIAAVGMAGWARLRHLELPDFTRRRGKPPVARWARRRDLAPLIVDGPKPGRVILGRRGRDLIAAEEGQSVIIFGPTQSGKTSGLVIPALLEWEGPVVATSVKSDILAPTLARREELGEVWVFDPTQSVDVERARATPLRAADTWHGALQTSHRLTESSKAGAGDLKDGNFWFANAAKLLAPVLLAANRAGGTMENVVTWIDEGPETCEGTVRPILEQSGEDAACRAFLATQNREERARSSIYTTTETIVAAWTDPRVVEETSGSDYSPEDLLDGGSNSLFLISPRSEQGRIRTIFSTLIEDLVAQVEMRSVAMGGPLDPRLLLALDECAHTAFFPQLPELAAIGSGLGVQLATVFQDLSQPEALLGRQRARSMVNNHRARMTTPGISDLETLDLFTRLAGTGEFDHLSVNSGQGTTRTSRTEGDQYRDLAPGHVVRQMPAGSALLAYGGLSLTSLRLRPWFGNC